MKNLRIKPGTLKIDELAASVQKHFGLQYRVTDNGKNEIVIARNKTIGCKLILMNKRHEKPTDYDAMIVHQMDMHVKKLSILSGVRQI